MPDSAAPRLITSGHTPTGEGLDRERDGTGLDQEEARVSTGRTHILDMSLDDIIQGSPTTPTPDGKGGGKGKRSRKKKPWIYKGGNQAKRRRATGSGGTAEVAEEDRVWALVEPGAGGGDSYWIYWRKEASAGGKDGGKGGGGSKDGRKGGGRKKPGGKNRQSSHGQTHTPASGASAGSSDAAPSGASAGGQMFPDNGPDEAVQDCVVDMDASLL